MSEQIVPDVELTSDVVVAEAAEAAETAVNYSEKNLAELVTLFEELVQNEERMTLSKEAEALKSAFYKRLQSAQILSLRLKEDSRNFTTDIRRSVPSTTGSLRKRERRILDLRKL